MVEADVPVDVDVVVDGRDKYGNGDDCPDSAVVIFFGPDLSSISSASASLLGRGYFNSHRWLM